MKTFCRQRLPCLILFGLLVLNLGVFGTCYRYLTKVDANYSRLLDQGIPFLNDMQTATAQASRTYALLVDLTRAENEAEIARMKSELVELRQVSDRIFSSPASLAAVPADLVPAYNEFLRLRQDRVARRAVFMTLIDEHNRVGAAEYLQREIYPAHKAYLGRIETFCDQYQASFANVHRELTLQNARGRTVVLGMAAAPLVLLTGIAVTALLAVVMLFTISAIPFSEARVKT